MVIWLIGKSAAGKTAIGMRLYHDLKAAATNTVFLDGDVLREAIGRELSYTVEDRYISEQRTSRLCKMLDDQGIHVVCAKLSNAPAIREWNRAHIKDYFEIYVRVDNDVLQSRDPKGIYRAYEANQAQNVVGKDIVFHEPTDAWMVIDNNGQEDVTSIVTRIKEKLMLTLPMSKRAPKSLSRPEWDYSEQAAYYHARPNYSDKAIDELVAAVPASMRKDLRVADIGAGTANLTVMLAERGFRPISVEPNSAMLAVGMERTKDMHVAWKLGTGETTGLHSDDLDCVFFGSSFNTTDSAACLREAHRVLKPGGLLTLMWNHRDVTNDPAQGCVEQIIRKHVPEYSPGTRREDPTEVVGRANLFDKVGYIEDSFVVHPTMEQYLDGWRSVKNRYWDVRTPKGRELLESILADIVDALGDHQMELTYTTRIWSWKVRK